MKTFLEILTLSTDYLAKCGLESPRREAEWLLADCFNLSRMGVYLESERPIQEDELMLFREKLKRRGKGEPGGYIHGSVDFYGLRIKVTPDVLIPRPETEILVDKIAGELSRQDLKGKVLLDLCSGSGCIGLALKKKFNDLTVVLSDISTAALLIAKENGKDLNVQYFQGDLFEPFLSQKFDYVVCNPPYISEDEFISLSPEVREFEPRGALLAGHTGLEFYERLKEELPKYLKSKAWLEIGYLQGQAVLALFEGPQWKSVRLEKDWSGHDRFISLEIE